MTTQLNSQIGYGGYTPEDLHTIVQRAHRERAQAVRELFTRLFARRKSAEERKQPAHTDALACS